MVNDTDSVSEINIHPTAILSVHNASEKKVDEIIIFLKSEILRDDEIFYGFYFGLFETLNIQNFFFNNSTLIYIQKKNRGIKLFYSI